MLNTLFSHTVRRLKPNYTRTLSTMSSMNAVFIEKHGGTEVLKHGSLPIPKANAGQILVKNQAIGVNFIDTYHRTGLYKVELPFILGREAAGIVEEVGPNVTNFKKGDHVAYLAGSTYADYTVADPGRTIKLPEEYSFREGAGLLIQGLTALSMLKYSYEVKKGDWVLVHAAAGGTGLWLVQLAKALGAHVIGTTSSSEKAKLAQEAGAEHIVLYTKEDVVQKVRSLTPGGEGVHAVYDGVGRSTFDQSLKCLRRLGTMVSFGNASGKVDPVDLFKLTEGNFKLLRPTLFNYIATTEEFKTLSEELLRLVVENNIKVPTNLYKLTDAAKAHEDLETRKTTGKLILEP
ncbi:uncharacterized protein VTP21DRAFT_1961 [Calcarisporiella thermophila]|uniref:uncharacterized protein n=1 Tax=Calcarisporiella thermophila TaxID=911321 RepID=UPI0037442BBB